MEVTATTTGPVETDADTVVIGVYAGKDVSHDLPGAPLGALLASGEAGRERGRIAVTHAEGKRWILVGLGDRDELTPERARRIAANAFARALELRCSSLCWEVPHHVDDAVVAALVEGTLLRAYRFDRYKAPAEVAKQPKVSSLTVSAHHDVASAVAGAVEVVEAQNRVRDLANLPGNALNPTALAAYATGLAGEIDALSVTVIDEAEIRSMGMGAFAAVAQGSSEPAKLIRLDYDGTAGRAPLLALVGKAVTFDSGGLWLKPSAKMHEMKFDMAGGAAVIEAVALLARTGAPVRVMGVVGSTENMISGRATRPGDIVTALDGTAVEINNTDAEGRLVLGDCITYARREGAERIVNIATLTGGVVISLGNAMAGLFSNDDSLAAAALASAERTGERLWRLPLDEHYANMIKPLYGQITNLTERREAQAITAAEFLHHFAGETPWAHLDIAGTAYDARNAYIADKGATGFGLRLLVDLARTLHS